MYRNINSFFRLSALYLILSSSGSAQASSLIIGGAWGPLHDSGQLSLDVSNDLLVSNYSQLVSFSNLSQESDGLTINYMKPALGNFVLDVGRFPRESTNAGSSLVIAGGRVETDNSYFASFWGGRFGVFSGFTDEQSPFSLGIVSSRSFGASLNYAGFYLSGAFKDTAIDGLSDGYRGEKSNSAVSLGYGSNAFNVRVTYLESEFSDGQPTDLEGKQWMIGGLLKLTPTILLNANAFVVNRVAQNFFPEDSGTGARFGVKLQF